jgi:hypothetical protein
MMQLLADANGDKTMSKFYAQPTGNPLRQSLLIARAGAICYVIWSLLHLLAASAVYRLGHTLDPSMIRGRLLQDAFNLAAFSVFGFTTAITLNWRNHIWGYWINLGVISVADVGFVVFVLVPGYMPLWPGVLGPLFWATGLVLTTVARLRTVGA